MFVLYFLAVILYNEGNAFSFRKQGGQNPSPHQGVRILLRKIGRDYGQICITFGF